MDTQIFNQGLSVPTTSAYIIIAALQADGLRPTLSAVAGRWNADRAGLDQALAELKAFNIIERHPGPEDEPIFLVNPASMWGAREEP
jgi:DNA-binding MarR family transcriptional regulator